MRVIAGKYKRRPLVAPEGAEVTRPTSDRVKESLFNILAFELQDAFVLDLFAGSGALGIEALSRGAKKVIFVEKDRAALRSLQQNLDKIGIDKNDYKIIAKDVEVFLENARSHLLDIFPREDSAASINLVIADPPYASPWYDKALEKIENTKLCGDGTLVVLEMARQRNLPTPPPEWSLEQERTYGTTKITFWRRGTP